MSRRRRERGQALVEFTLVAPVLFLMLFAIIQLGLLFGAQNGFVNGVRDAARRASTYRVNELTFVDAGLKADICTAITDELVRQLGGNQMPGFDPNGEPGDRLTLEKLSYVWGNYPAGGTTFLSVNIEATYDHPLYVPLISGFFDLTDGTADGSLTLRASEQMRIENPPQLPPGSTEVIC
ncbi:MAG TPA: TadE/TadG family type IV pilus assembly protein [Candidatus Deferrimicrobiaceae bacterium]|nr:TadE/TadG family type IV pilus assembly protein [Candidatus Deferrimicrobiaceae bacterium]